MLSSASFEMMYLLVNAGWFTRRQGSDEGTQGPVDGTNVGRRTDRAFGL